MTALLALAATLLAIGGPSAAAPQDRPRAFEGHIAHIDRETRERSFTATTRGRRRHDPVV